MREAVSRRDRPRSRSILAGLGAATLLLAACSSGAGQTGGGAAPSEFTYLTNVENTTTTGVLEQLAQAECASAQEALPLSVETVPQTQLDQRLQLLAGQAALPVQYVAGNAPALTTTLADAGHVLDFEQALTDLDLLDRIEPAAVSTIRSLYGDRLSVLPYEFNIEGIWYNRQLFAANGITEPTTWDELVTAARTLQAAGVTPFSASGEQGWPITRLISNYLQRDLGPDALQRVADGSASLSDPEYVRAAQAVADLGASGFFGQGVGSIDYDTSVSQFLTGQAGMLYMGSWVLSSLNDPESNQIGLENVGFMPFPTVTGGSGTADQYTANVGLPTTLNARTYDGPDGPVGGWLRCITENYGAAALAEGSISGFTVEGETPEVSPLTQDVRDRIAGTTQSILFFEALFSTQATTTSQSTAAQLVTGGVTAQEFMDRIQADNAG